MRNFEIEFSEETKNDLADHMLRYEDLRTGWECFTDELKANLTTVASVPFLHVRYDEIRCVSLMRFPYMIHYSAFPERELIRIHAIIHTARNPDKSWGKTIGWSAKRCRCMECTRMIWSIIMRRNLYQRDTASTAKIFVFLSV